MSMEVRKESNGLKNSMVTREELAIINRFTKRALREDEVYTFAVRLCDNEVDRDGERFPRATLEELAELFVGKSGIFDHEWTTKGQAARIYRTEVVEEEGVCSQGEGRCSLTGYGRKMLLTLLIEVYAPRTLGAAGCEEAAETVTQALMTALPEGLKLRSLQWGKTGWDKTTGMFRLDASAKYAAYFVAEAAEDETVFTDFVLKGTVKERE